MQKCVSQGWTEALFQSEAQQSSACLWPIPAYFRASSDSKPRRGFVPLLSDILFPPFHPLLFTAPPFASATTPAPPRFKSSRTRARGPSSFRFGTNAAPPMVVSPTRTSPVTNPMSNSRLLPLTTNNWFLTFHSFNLTCFYSFIFNVLIIIVRVIQLTRTLTIGDGSSPCLCATKTNKKRCPGRRRTVAISSNFPL